MKFVIVLFAAVVFTMVYDMGAAINQFMCFRVFWYISLEHSMWLDSAFFRMTSRAGVDASKSFDVYHVSHQKFTCTTMITAECIADGDRRVNYLMRQWFWQCFNATLSASSQRSVLFTQAQRANRACDRWMSCDFVISANIMSVIWHVTNICQVLLIESNASNFVCPHNPDKTPLSWHFGMNGWN